MCQGTALFCSENEILDTEVTTDVTKVQDDDLIMEETDLLATLGLEADDASSLTDKGGKYAKHYVYTQGNQVEGNEIIMFTVDNKGMLTESAHVAIGGEGTGAGLGNQGALALSRGGHLLFAVNAGSNELSCFYVGRNGFPEAGPPIGWPCPRPWLNPGGTDDLLRSRSRQHGKSPIGNARGQDRA